MGPPPFISYIPLLSPQVVQAILHWGTHFCMCIINPIIFYSFGNCIKNLLIFNKFIDVFHHSRWCFFFGTKKPMSPLVGASPFHSYLCKNPSSGQNPKYQRHPCPKPLYFDLSYISLQSHPFNTVYPIFGHPPDTISCFTVSSIHQYNPNQGKFLNPIYFELRPCYQFIHLLPIQFLTPF
jgi:hypothetical protein